MTSDDDDQALEDETIARFAILRGDGLRRAAVGLWMDYLCRSLTGGRYQEHHKKWPPRSDGAKMMVRNEAVSLRIARRIVELLWAEISRPTEFWGIGKVQQMWKLPPPSEELSESLEGANINWCSPSDTIELIDALAEACGDELNRLIKSGDIPEASRAQYTAHMRQAFGNLDTIIERHPFLQDDAIS